MEIRWSHSWDINIHQARELQDQLSRSIVHINHKLSPRTIAGIDVSISRFSKEGRAAIVVLSYPSLEPINLATAQGNITFPYIPGLLSFRETPLVLEAWKGLKIRPDMALIDGQGIAHPRRLGIASHLGLLLDIPTIGCAKSRLIGSHEPVPAEAGAYSFLMDQQEVIGAAVRTKRAVNPLYISVGHKIDLAGAILWVMNCCRGFRLPEPTRLAHMAAGGLLKNPPVQYYTMSNKRRQE